MLNDREIFELHRLGFQLIYATSVLSRSNSIINTGALLEKKNVYADLQLMRFYFIFFSTTFIKCQFINWNDLSADVQIAKGMCSF